MDNSDKLGSLEAEAAVLGSMIIDSGCIGKILPILSTEQAFFEEEHQILFSALIRLYTDKNPTDAVALRTELKRTNQLDNVGGVEYIAKIMDSVPSSANAAYYAGIVQDRQQFRNLATTVEQIKDVLNEPFSVGQQTQKIQDLALSLKDEPRSGIYTFAENAVNVANTIQSCQSVIPTGFRAVDEIVGGVSAGKLCIIAGRPSMGKSAFALDIALNMAEAGKSILFFTLEMTYRNLIERALCNRSKTNMMEIKYGSLGADEVTQKAYELERLDFTLYEGAATAERQIAIIREQKKRRKLGIVFIDYIQLMHTGSKTENRVQEITKISRRLKLAALQEQIPIIVLSQLNRQVESRDKHRPRMSDLRESGALEQDADIVMLLHRMDYYRRNEDPYATQDGSAEVIVAKNKDGPTGIANLDFLAETVRFRDVETKS